jgi:hypothetical protein
MARPRAIGLMGIGAVTVAAGAATLLRSGYVAIPAWRLTIAACVIGLGLLTLLAALKSSK